MDGHTPPRNYAIYKSDTQRHKEQYWSKKTWHCCRFRILQLEAFGNFKDYLDPLKILDKKKLQKKLAKSCNGLPKYKPKSLYIQNNDNFFYPITFYLNMIATKPSAEF